MGNRLQRRRRPTAPGTWASFSRTPRSWSSRHGTASSTNVKELLYRECYTISETMQEGGRDRPPAIRRARRAGVLMATTTLAQGAGVAAALPREANSAGECCSGTRVPGGDGISGAVRPPCALLHGVFGISAAHRMCGRRRSAVHSALRRGGLDWLLQFGAASVGCICDARVMAKPCRLARRRARSLFSRRVAA